MKNYFIMYIVILLGSISAFAQDSVQFKRQDISLPSEFAEALKRAQMSFEMPEGYTATKVIENEDVGYAFAVKSPDKKLEVRYAVWPLDSMIARYNLPRKEGETMIDPNTICQTETLMNMANISVTPLDRLQNIVAFDSDAVRNEFNADWGGTATVELRKSFGQKNKWCSVVALHKDKIADAWLFFLARNKDELLAHMDAAFHSLRFK